MGRLDGTDEIDETDETDETDGTGGAGALAGGVFTAGAAGTPAVETGAGPSWHDDRNTAAETIAARAETNRGRMLMAGRRDRSTHAAGLQPSSRAR